MKSILYRYIYDKNVKDKQDDQNINDKHVNDKHVNDKHVNDKHVKYETVAHDKRDVQSRPVTDTATNTRVLDPVIPSLIFPPPLPPPPPVLTKYLKRDYAIFDTTDDQGNVYRYGLFGVYSSFTKINADGSYADPTLASNVSNETRVLIVKTLIVPASFNSQTPNIKNISPIYVDRFPKIEFQTSANETPTQIIDQIYTYQTGGVRPDNVRKTTQKIVLRDTMQDVIDPLGSPYAIDTAISQNLMFFDPYILDLYYTIVNNSYVSSATPYSVLLQTIIVMLGI